jgi:hypoxanthine phosphoribosyltransferase
MGEKLRPKSSAKSSNLGLPKMSAEATLNPMMKLLYSAEAIQGRVNDIADALNRQFKGEKTLHTVVTMNGAHIFAADLVRRLQVPQVMHFTGGSYFQGAIKHEVSMNAETLPSNFNQTPVLVIEDILDSGNAIRQLRHILAERGAGPITVVSLFKRVGSPALAEHSAFALPRELFVVGYGLDMDGRYRELPGIYTFESTVLTGQSGNC